VGTEEEEEEEEEEEGAGFETEEGAEGAVLAMPVALICCCL
jgi:hypothetical protein